MASKRIAVLIIVENLPVPFDRRVWQEARALGDAGYRVSVICPKGKGFERGHEILEDIEIYRHRLWEAGGPLGYLFEYMWALLAEFVLALRAFARTRFRVLQACNPPDTIFLIGWFFKILGVRFIFDHHDLNPELFEAKFGRHGPLYRLLCLAERLTFRTADVSIATNASFREIALTRGKMRSERVFVVHSCPDLSTLPSAMDRPQLREDRKHLVLYLGVMGSQDGLDLLVESIAFLIHEKHREDTLFVLVGDGPALPRIRALITEKGLDAVVKFTGSLYGEKLAAYLATADVAVAPDPKNPMNDKSTMNKVLEYMTYGRPVVLYDLTEGRRSAGDAALYACPNNPVDFAEKILRLLDSPELRRELGARGRRRIEEQLNWEIEKRSLLAAYETALK